MSQGPGWHLDEVHGARAGVSVPLVFGLVPAPSREQILLLHIGADVLLVQLQPGRQAQHAYLGPCLLEGAEGSHPLPHQDPARDILITGIPPGRQAASPPPNQICAMRGVAL